MRRAAVAALLVVLLAPTAAAAKVPRDFFGVMANGPLDASSFPSPFHVLLHQSFSAPALLPSVMVVWVFVLMVLGVTLTAGLKRLERWVAPWSHANR